MQNGCGEHMWGVHLKGVFGVSFGVDLQDGCYYCCRRLLLSLASSNLSTKSADTPRDLGGLRESWPTNFFFVMAYGGVTN
jgi:hypothetical protein